MSSANPLLQVYGSNFIVRPPAAVTINKAGANYKSEIAHLSYSPRQAYDEWLSICEAICALGGDAIFEDEAVDEPFLDHKHLRVHGDGSITAHGESKILGHVDAIETGRVFTANGPWVTVRGDTLRCAMQNMLPHRRSETPYYESILQKIAEASSLKLELHPCPHPWEGMADVAVVGDEVILTYAVPGHYDENTSPKSRRSSKEGVTFAADIAGVDPHKRLYVELVYPHFHGDTVHFGARPTLGLPAALVHYPQGLWRDGSKTVREFLHPRPVFTIDQTDAVENYAGNSRQVKHGVMVPDGVSSQFEQMLTDLGLSIIRVPLFELFGKAGGGPACATLYLPSNLALPHDFSLRYSQRKDQARAKRARLAETVTVDADYFSGKSRG